MSELTCRVVGLQEFFDSPDIPFGQRSNEIIALNRRIEFAVAQQAGLNIMKTWIIPPGSGTAADWLALSDLLIERGDPMGEAIVEGHRRWLADMEEAA